MKKLTKVPVRNTTVKLIGRILQPISETGTITYPELNEIMSNLRNLAQKGELLPDVIPKLIEQRDAAQMRVIRRRCSGLRLLKAKIP